MAGQLAGFHPVDYVVFILTIVVSLGIGVYHAVRGGGQKSTGQFLMGNRDFKIIPVALSMLVSIVSAVGILGLPAEMYAFGTQYSMYMIASVIGCSVGAMVFVPLFFPLKLTSSFEYFEMRFNSKLLRLTGTSIMLLNQLFMNGTGLFAPSIALEAVTGFPVWISIILCGISATIYTTLGGMKAVIYTDVFQSVIIFFGLLAIVIQGVIKVGGLGMVWELNDKWGRIEFFDFSIDPRERTTFWSVVVMMSVLWMCLVATQTSVQRYCALPNMRAAKISVFLNIPGFIIVGVLSCLAGMVAFAYYAKVGCDPMSMKYISNPNQIIPYFVMDVMGYPGLPGIFVACLYSGALSTASSSLNAMAAVTWEDMLKWKFDYLKDRTKANITRAIVVVYGAISVAVGFVVSFLGGTFIQIVFSILGTTAGPLVGMFILGGMYPRAGWKGTFIGVVVGMSLSLWMAIGAYVQGSQMIPLPLPKSNCPVPNLNASLLHAGSNVNTTEDGVYWTATLDYTLSYVTEESMDTGRPAGGARGGQGRSANVPRMKAQPQEFHGLENLYAVSYLWYPSVGITSVCLIGFITSFIPGFKQEGRVPKKYLFICARRYASSCQPEYYDSDYDSSDDEDDFDAEGMKVSLNGDISGDIHRMNGHGAARKLITSEAESVV